VTAEPALVREAGPRRDLRQREVAAGLRELLGSVDAASDEVLVRRQPGGPLEPLGEVVGVEAGDPGQLPRGRPAAIVPIRRLMRAIQLDDRSSRQSARSFGLGL
jgi:hypothetical protein